MQQRRHSKARPPRRNGNSISVLLAERLAPRVAVIGVALQGLTGTERDILRLVTEGKSNAEAARILGLSPRTVETYRMRLMRKLAIDNLAALVKYAIRRGITPLD